MHDYCSEDDAAIERALSAYDDGPPPSVTNKLTYAECAQAVRSGVLPNGQALQADLHGYVGRSIVIDLRGTGAAAEVARGLGSSGVASLVRTHIAAAPEAGGQDGGLLAAAAARILITEAEPFRMGETDLHARLTDPSLVPMLRRMLYLEDDGAPLSDDALLDAVTAITHEEALGAMPWLAAEQQPSAVLEDALFDMSTVVPHVANALNTCSEGAPKVHAALVRAHGNHVFAVAWQTSMEHSHRLRRKRRAPTPPPPQGNDSPHVAPTRADQPRESAHAEALRLARQAGAPATHA